MRNKASRQAIPNLEATLALTIDEAAFFSRLSRTSIYALIADGHLESTKVAGRRLVTTRSLRRLIEGDAAVEQAPVAA